MKEATRLRNEADMKARIAAHVQKVCEDFPPLSPAQSDRLALLLNPRIPDADVAHLEPLGGSVLDEMLGRE